MATANLTNDVAGRIHIVDADVHAQIDVTAAVDLTAGQVVKLDTNGKAALADADTETTRDQCWIATRTVKAGMSITISKHMVIDGLGVTGMAFGDPLYLSNTAGAISSGIPGTGATIILGRVEPVFANGATADRLARFCTL